ncbi:MULTISPECIES: haloacid dehalogenase-like hydrolase [unclassified Streptomyces]|uniref:haloacid dehalogenase-like hydrolase n=1 Tax=unclassified Streptomyces TaxID=2593676 RepID=UPI00224D54AE|nr:MULTISPECIES: haloacid dehalogenase-like hydrolase [unclassified Streptomyces]MCX4992140.1 haloacid dehalogenase-like hydrolase [Streptomyces sp. NBC_00568]MCX5002624.1 haloacid dehalogenase-like hydrolase [Streptomyces sp. NBC_00638]
MRHRRFRPYRHIFAWTLAAAATLAASPPTAPAPPADCPHLSAGWYGDNRARLQEVIDARGTCAGDGNGNGGRPVAAFDWDNTVTKNDVTDATVSWALRHDRILRPASWKATSAWLTDAADTALTAACGTRVPAGAPLPTATSPRCTDEILEIRETGRTMSGAAAFAGDWNHRRTVPQYAWVPQLFAGHTVAELSAYARRARAEALAAPVGATRTLGTHTVPAYVRYYDRQRDLIRTLRRAGFDVYIVSAGSEPVTEVWSRGVGIDAAHTIAIRSVLDRHGRITTRNEGCGDVPASRGEAIPYIDGKRCWLNQEVYGVRGAAAWQRQDARHRTAIAAGDADTDVTFVGDATGAHLVLNRNKGELMCRAYDDADGRWVINPMFIEPLPRRQGLYPCSTSAYTAPDGTPGPVRRPDGSVVPDLADTVH